MGNLGIPEIMVILVVALLVFGPNKVPEVARQVGRGMRELRKIQDSLRGDVAGLFDLDDDDDDEPTAPFHPTPPPPLSTPPPAPLPGPSGRAMPSRYRTPDGRRVPAPARPDRDDARTDAAVPEPPAPPVPRVSAPSRFRPPPRPDAS